VVTAARSARCTPTTSRMTRLPCIEPFSTSPGLLPWFLPVCPKAQCRRPDGVVTDAGGASAGRGGVNDGRRQSPLRG
jgi:hypothetical protein